MFHARLGRFVLIGALGLAAAVRADAGARAIDSDLFSDLTWRCIGPFDGGPVVSVTGVAGEPGVYVVTTPSAGPWKTTDGGDTWASIDRQDLPAPGSDPRRWTDPANPRRI